MKQFDLVIFLPHGDWELNTRRQMILALARAVRHSNPGARILCVERPICPVSTPILHRRRFVAWAQGKKRLHQVTDNLWKMTPWVLIHDLVALEIPLLARANNMLQRHQVRRALASIEAVGERLVVWLFHPYQRHYCDMIEHDVLIYEVYDEYSESPYLRGKRHRARQVALGEQAVLRRADLVLTTAAKIRRRLASSHSRVFWVPNGVEFDHFARSPEGPGVPKELCDIRRPLVGFVGKINEKIDYSLLDHLATAHPEWSLILLGLFDGQPSLKQRADFVRVQSRRNVHFLGWKDYAALPGYVQAFDVCLIPFVLNKLTEGVYPLKLHEYLAAGKPVVSTALGEVARFREVVRIADTPAQFEGHVVAALAERDTRSRQRRVAVARDNSWEKRAETVLGLIDDILAQSPEVLA